MYRRGPQWNGRDDFPDIGMPQPMGACFTAT
jgi:hypothetical protein